ncbi:MAG: tetratricopeptide repeat protein [Nannocystales bacterium]
MALMRDESRPDPLATEDTVVATPGSLGSVTLPEPGDAFGRYRLERHLGTGGMGVVFAAHDPTLDRVVALKLLKHGADAGTGRLKREAQALAQLQHPNVIAVFEVGEADGIHFIAMEYVSGRTLKRWLLDSTRSVTEVLDVFVQAGRGLQAAHDAGLVHRDFKPSNVLVGDDGRVCVVDFGIATAHSLGFTLDPGLLTQDLPVDAGEDLTGTGMVLGTPAYMAPEQHVDGEIDARSDQFSFCASLYEALYGVRPFEGTNDRNIAVAKRRMNLTAPEEERTVPTRVRRATLRGLQPSPSERWPSMIPLIRALERASRPRRRPVLWAAGIAAVLGAGVVAAERDQGHGCRPGAERAAEVWSDARAASVQRRFEELKGPLGVDAARGVDAWLRPHLEVWSEQHDEVCRARAAGEIDDDGLDLRMHCVQARLAETSAIVDVLLDADADVVTKSTQAAASLLSPSICSDVDALRVQSAPPPPVSLAAEVERIRELLAIARAQETAGRWSLGYETAKKAEAAAEGVPYRPTQLEAALVSGVLATRLGELEAAKTKLTETAHDAAAEGLDHFAALAAGQLVFVQGYQLADREAGLQWGRHADAAAQRARLQGRRLARIRSNIASVYFGMGDYETAATHYRETIALLEQSVAPDHPDIANLLNNLGGALVNLGRFDEAETALDRARRVWSTQLGERHPLVAVALTSQSALYERRREYDKALEVSAIALSIRRDELGAEHPSVATTLDNQASLQLYTGQLKEAEAAARQALALRRKTFPESHPHIASSLTNLGMILEKQERFEDAATVSRQAAEMWDATLGPEHLHSAYPRTALGIALLGLGEPERALEPLRVSVTLRRDAKREPHLLARSAFALGRALAATQKQLEACELYDEALKLYEDEGLDEDAATVRAARKSACQ